MAKDQATQNQKVFIRLDNLIDVQNEYNRLRNTIVTGDDTAKHLTTAARKIALEWVLDTLQLPRAGN